ncbi:sporulenol synthase [Pullulanibacillus pueri]|uniref:Sporulenol synthase n=1 Tax=Pullulanibacillus pueri TaxID=1437324 RepID=A0A8J3EJS2_9BACL|nr:squalene--hopene cyclase [Pullulanibacillus pueri]MBM7679845.1 sporulenol synthase [Pullulanibacillus pueri]GGH73126.1 sporulenol synthase [Pullulanibacillus pueri]
MDGLEVSQEIKRRIDLFLQEQWEDGAWRYCFEGPVMTDAYMIITLRALEIDEEPLIKRLVERLLSVQEDNGVWKVYPDEPEGNLSATVEAVVALLYSGYVETNDEKMKKAYAFIRAHGGLKKSGLLTRAFLAMNGLYPWPHFPFNPAYLVLLPRLSPINFYSFSSYARAHFAPVLAAFEHRFSIKTKQPPNLEVLTPRSHREEERSFWPEVDQLFIEQRAWPLSQIKKEIYKWKQIPSHLLKRADRWIEHYIYSHLEANGTLLSYASSTFLMIYGLLALGYHKDSPVILKAVQGLSTLIFEDDLFHLQNSPSTVWDTGLMTYALLEAGCSPDHPAIMKASEFLLHKQQKNVGDWAHHNPKVAPGGWGFSDSNTRHPDMDDTQTVLRTIAAYTMFSNGFNASFERGFNWLLSMQNSDGGWAAFEKNVDLYLLALLPMSQIENAAIDPSTPDITGRVLHAIGTLGETTNAHSHTAAAVKWLRHRQERDGSWRGRWGVCYIYGTWAALTGLSAVGLENGDRTIQKGVKWLHSIQNKDGGWGESCQSDAKRHYEPLGQSTSVQTAWAIDALIATHQQPTDAIERGIAFLLKHNSDTTAFEPRYPTGIGLPGQFYIYYHGYPKYWPLLTLAHYQKKFGELSDE